MHHIHPTFVTELARQRMQEDIARAEAYRLARAAREARRAERDARAVAHTRGVRLFLSLRGAARGA